MRGLELSLEIAKRYGGTPRAFVHCIGNSAKHYYCTGVKKEKQNQRDF